MIMGIHKKCDDSEEIYIYILLSNWKNGGKG